MVKELEVCKICGDKVSALSHFYRNHGLVLQDYVVKHFPRFDLLEKTPIIYKSPEQYFSSDFNNKNNLKKYLKNLPTDDAGIYCKNLLKKRVIEKSLIYTPLQIELVSLPCFPPINYLSTLFDYYKFCAELGLKSRVLPLVGGISVNDPLDNYITIDSRESQPLKFDVEYRVGKLDFGDYHFSGNPSLYFERKSISDFLGTLSQGFERFTKELERAEAAKAYLVMIIEDKLSNVLAFNHLPWMNRVKTKATPEFIFHNLRSLIQRFPNFQPLFVKNRAESVDYIMKGFLSGDVFKKIDLQLAYQLEKI